MNHNQYDDAYLKAILNQVKSIAVVGASHKTIRPSNTVSQFLVAKGYDVIPVNPGHAGKLIAGKMTFASLADINRPIDMVDIFRHPDAVYGVVEEALQLKTLPRVIWMQLGVRNDKAAELAEQAGIKVVMNRCPKIETARLIN